MSSIEMINIDVYPWAAPTDAQRAWFRMLSPEEKREAIRRAIEEGFASPTSTKSIDDIIEETRADLPDAL